MTWQVLLRWLPALACPLSMAACGLVISGHARKGGAAATDPADRRAFLGQRLSHLDTLRHEAQVELAALAAQMAGRPEPAPRQDGHASTVGQARPCPPAEAHVGTRPRPADPNLHRGHVPSSTRVLAQSAAPPQSGGGSRRGSAPILSGAGPSLAGSGMSYRIPAPATKPPAASPQGVDEVTATDLCGRGCRPSPAQSRCAPDGPARRPLPGPWRTAWRRGRGRARLPDRSRGVPGG